MGLVRPQLDPKLCFVPMPVGTPFEGYYEHIIRPAICSAGLEAQRADEIFTEPENITLVLSRLSPLGP